MALTAVMSAAALLISALRVEVPFYPLVFLKFDFAEVPSVLAFTLAGPRWGYLCAVFHYAGLLSRGSDPLGPTMKFLAVVSMLAGMHAGGSRWKLALLCGMAVRAAAMALANLVVLGLLFPHWLSYSIALLSAAGLKVSGWWDAMAMTIILVSVYNCVHVLLSIIPAELIAREVRRRLGVE